MPSGKKIYKGSRSKKGGAGGAENAIAVYGLPSQQHAMVGSNEIAYNAMAINGGSALMPSDYSVVAPLPAISVPVSMPTVSGGADMMPTSIPGGGVLTDIAVPAVLFAANKLYNPKKSVSNKDYRRKSYSRRYTRGGEAGVAALAGLESQLEEVNTGGKDSSLIQNMLGNPQPTISSTPIMVNQLNPTTGGAMMIPVFMKSMMTRKSSPMKKRKYSGKKSARKSKGRKGRK